MKQPLTPTPTQLRTEPPLLLTRDQLKEWLQVSRTWVDMRVADPEFAARCVVDIATPGSSHRKLRFPASAVAEYLGIPDSATPKLTAAA